MNRKLVSKAFSNIDDTFIAETMSPPAVKANHAPERTIHMRKFETKRSAVHSRRLFSLILAACLVFAMAVTAYAFNLLGIRELFRKTNGELPEEAVPHIQQHTETAAEEDWSARITESLCDESKILITVTVSGGDKYILAPTDADPDRTVGIIGLDGDQTLGEYAKEQGKQLLFVGATLKENASLGGHGSQYFENVSDNEMTILIQADKIDSLIGNEILCRVYAVDEEWNKLTLDIPFILGEAPSEEMGIFIPVDSDAIPGITVGNAEVTETPLGWTVRFMSTVTDQTAFENIKKMECDEITDFKGGGFMLEDDGNWYTTLSMGQGIVNDTLTIRFYDWDDQVIDTITFNRK